MHQLVAFSEILCTVINGQRQQLDLDVLFKVAYLFQARQLDAFEWDV